MMRRRPVLALLAFVVAASGGCPSVEVDAGTLLVLPGSVSFATLGRELQLRAAIVTPAGDTVTDRAFTWTSSDSQIVRVAPGGATGTLTARSNGAATITVTAGSLRREVPVTVAQFPANLSKVSGDRQFGSDGSFTGELVVVFARDSAGTAAAGAPVTFAVTAGGGSVSPAQATTDGAGRASTAWRLGSGVQGLRATAGSAPPVDFTATSLPAPQPGFQITLLNIGAPFSADVQTAFTAATTFWQTAITGDLPDVAGFQMQAGQCGTGSPALSLTVDDVIILANVVPIDGPGGILGSAGPCFFRLGTAALEQTVIGVMRFDSDDIAGLASSGRLDAVIRHEMAHVLGFGPLWPAAVGSNAGFGCLQNPSSPNQPLDTHYSCARGRAVFDSIGGTSYTAGSKVPVENCAGIAGCGAGTYNSHWRESTFFNELMTGYLNSSTTNPTSVLTLAAFQDLGYTVNLAAAEAYSRTFAAPAAASGAVIALGNDGYDGPVYGVTVRNGRAQRVTRLR